MTWFKERLADAFMQHPSIFIYTVVTLTLLIILAVDYFKMKNNQIDRQVANRLSKGDKDKEKNGIKDLHVPFIDKLYARQEEKIKLTLKRANVLFTAKEFLTFMTIGSVVGFTVGMVVYPLPFIWKSVFVFLSLDVAQQALGRLLAAFVLGFAGSYFPFGWVKYLEGKRRKAMEGQIQDALLNIADALKSGHIIGDAIRIVGQDMPYPIGHEFAQAHKEMEAGRTLKEALYDLKKRVNIEDFTMAMDAMEIQYEVGGELEPLLRKMVTVVQERQGLKQEVKKTIANAKMTGTILMCAPAGFAALFITMSKDQFLVMIQSAMGWLLLGVGAVTYAIGIVVIYLIIRNITKEI